jgi:glycosyltransferase involved in cell wall biosynthesis
MTNPSLPRLHVVYEYGIDYRPHSSPYLRLIRPFSHPLVTPHIQATFDLDYHQSPSLRKQAADLVILERLWRPDVTLEATQQLIERIHRSGARFIYSLDDNFFDLVLENKGWPPPEFLPIVEYCLQQADGVMSSTDGLRQRLLEFAPASLDAPKRWLVIPNALDECLLVRRTPPEPGQPLVIGCMGTATHDEDLLMILPALQAFCQRHPGQVELQMVGVTRKAATRQALEGLPVRYIDVRPEEQEYPLFMTWFSANLRWDIAISPLRETPFNRTKSDIKFLDYAAIGAAGIFSRGPAYETTVQHQQTGWLAENTPTAWEEALETLLADPGLRLHLAQSATHYLYTERILAQRASIGWRRSESG